jgi:hypothetical protein
MGRKQTTTQKLKFEFGWQDSDPKGSVRSRARGAVKESGRGEIMADKVGVAGAPFALFVFVVASAFAKSVRRRPQSRASR